MKSFSGLSCALLFSSRHLGSIESIIIDLILFHLKNYLLIDNQFAVHKNAGLYLISDVDLILSPLVHQYGFLQQNWESCIKLDRNQGIKHFEKTSYLNQELKLVEVGYARTFHSFYLHFYCYVRIISLILRCNYSFGYLLFLNVFQIFYDSLHSPLCWIFSLSLNSPSILEDQLT